MVVDLSGRRLRVALALPDLVGGGAERVFLDIADGLLVRGVDVDVVVSRDRGALRSTVPDGARMVVLGSEQVAACVPRFTRYLRTDQPGVVVSALSHMNLAAIAACRMLRPRMPVVVTQHNHLSTFTAHAQARRDRVMPTLIRCSYPWADRIAAAGAAPVDHPWLVTKTGPVVLGIGRLVDQKDFATLIRAFSRLPDTCRLVILGEGEGRPALEALAKDLGVAERIDLPGFVDNPYPALRAADCFVLSSRWEGLPTVLIEALAFDTPVVATDCDSGPAEILEGGAWGRLVPTVDPQRLAEAIAAALDGPRVDRPLARLPFQPETVTQRYLDLLPPPRARR